MDLHNLKHPNGARKNRKRVGRGPGSGSGKTAGRGHKGQKSRSGGSISADFEGGQMPLARRLPKRGFTNLFAKEWSVINVRDLERCFDDGATVDAESLAEAGLIWYRFRRTKDGDKVRQTRPVRVLGKGDLSKKLTVKAGHFSKGAAEKITSAGGSIEVI